MIRSVQPPNLESFSRAGSALGNEHLKRRLYREIIPSQVDTAIFDRYMESGLNQQIAKILARRTGSRKECFVNLNCSTAQTFYGHLFPRLGEFADLLFTPATRDRGVAVVFDYDADGITSASQFKLLFDRYRIPATWITPRRQTDGYGLKQWMIELAAKEQRRLLLTLDCGTADLKMLNYAQSLGLTPVVIDHHIPTSEVMAGLIFNPFVADIEELKVRSAAGLVHDTIIAALALRGGVDRSFYARSLSLAAIGTVADVMRIQGVNRALVSQGLKVLQDSDLPGICALRAVSKKRGLVDCRELGFHLGPHINAPGRMDEKQGAMLPLQLLTSVDEAEAVELAERVQGWNIRRQERQLADSQLARTEILGASSAAHGICISHLEFHLGTVGLVASALSQEFEVPALVCGFDPNNPEILKGSLRVPEGYDGIALLEQCRGTLLQYGGHVRAGGVSLLQSNFQALVEIFNLASQQQSMHLPDDRDSKVVRYDYEIDLSDVSLELARKLHELGPYGEGFSSPIFLIRNVVLSNPRVFQGHSIDVTARRGDHEINLRLRGIRESSILDYDTCCDVALSISYTKLNSLEYALCSIEAVSYRDYS